MAAVTTKFPLWDNKTKKLMFNNINRRAKPSVNSEHNRHVSVREADGGSDKNLLLFNLLSVLPLFCICASGLGGIFKHRKQALYC